MKQFTKIVETANWTVQDILENALHEAKKIESDADFKKWAETVLKNAHGDKFDQKIADKMIADLSKKYKNNYGAMIGALSSGLNEAFNEAKDNFEEAKKQARKISKEEGVAQHVNQVSNGVYQVSDWFDSDSTMATFINGVLESNVDEVLHINKELMNAADGFLNDILKLGTKDDLLDAYLSKNKLSYDLSDFFSAVVYKLRTYINESDSINESAVSKEYDNIMDGIGWSTDEHLVNFIELPPKDLAKLAEMLYKNGLLFSEKNIRGVIDIEDKPDKSAQISKADFNKLIDNLNT